MPHMANSDPREGRLPRAGFPVRPIGFKVISPNTSGVRLAATSHGNATLSRPFLVIANP
jgi:hypothetical protein